MVSKIKIRAEHLSVPINQMLQGRAIGNKKLLKTPAGKYAD